jgi:hypothetical protein
MKIMTRGHASNGPRRDRPEACLQWSFLHKEEKMVRSVALFVALVTVAAVGQVRAQDPSLVFGVEFDGVACGGSISGSQGETRRIVAFATVTVDASREAMVSGWGLSIAGAGGSIVFGQDFRAPGRLECPKECLSTIIYGPDAFGDEVFFHAPTVVDPTKNDQGPGIIAGTALDVEHRVTLPVGTNRVLPFWIEVTFGAQPETVSITFRDGLAGPADATNNEVAIGTTSVKPTVTNCTFTLAVSVPGQIPGDTNQNGALDALDAIQLLNHYFLGDPATLPCGNGSVYDPANVTLLDGNGDGEIDLTDAVQNLRQLFLGGAPHAAGTTCTPISGCPAVCGA